MLGAAVDGDDGGVATLEGDVVVPVPGVPVPDEGLLVALSDGEVSVDGLV